MSRSPWRSGRRVAGRRMRWRCCARAALPATAWVRGSCGWKPRCPPWSAACWDNARPAGGIACEAGSYVVVGACLASDGGRQPAPLLAVLAAAVGIAGLAREFVAALAAQAGTAVRAGVRRAREAALRRHRVALRLGQVQPATGLQLRRQRQVAEADTDQTRDFQFLRLEQAPHLAVLAANQRYPIPVIR